MKVELSKEEREFIAGQIVEAVIPEIKRTISELLESPWMDRREAAGYLEISTTILDRLRRNGTIPEVLMSDGVIRFHREDLDEVLRGMATRQGAGGPRRSA